MKKNIRKIVFNLCFVLIIFQVKIFAVDVTPDLGPVTSKDVIYQIITDRFYDGDVTNNIPQGFDASLFDGTGMDLKLYQGGDWQGIIEKIPYLKEMGISCVWISAPYSNRDNAIIDYNQSGNDVWTSFHGYHVKNFYATNLHFGDMQDFNRLQDELQENGMKLVIDFVTNHTSRWENPTLNFAAEDGRLYEPDKDEQGRYVFDTNGNLMDYNNDGIVHNLLADPHNDVNGWFHGLGDRGADASRFGFRHKDLGSLADLSQENEQVVKHLEDAMKFWANKGVNGIRHDATLHMNPAFITGLRDAIDSGDGGPLYHFGEFFIGRPDPKYEEYKDFPNKTGVHNLDFEFYRTITSTFGDFSTDMNNFADMLMYTQEDYIYENQAVTFIDNHDVTRFGYIQRNEKAYNATLATLMTCRGIPNIYYGTEQYVVPDEASDIAGRIFMQREVPFDTSSIAYNVIKNLSSLRQENDALAYGMTNILHCDSDVIVYQRQFFDNQVIVAINRQPDRGFTVPRLSTSLPVGSYSDYLDGLLGGETMIVNSDGQANAINSFYLEGGEVCVWSYPNNESSFIQELSSLTTEGALHLEIKPDMDVAGVSMATDNTTAKIGEVISIMGRPGNIVHINGDNFGTNPEVKFDDITGQILETTNRTIKCIVPNIPAGVTHITIETPGGISNKYRYQVLTDDQTQVIFHVKADTNLGENIHIIGNASELGNWDTNQLSEPMMCPNSPEWFLPVSVPKGKKLEFKFIKKDANGTVVWEQSANREITTSGVESGVVNTPMYKFGE